jgi:hypothetical protein
MSVHPINPPPADRLTAVDIAMLTDVETRAALVHIAGHRDPALAAAAAEAVRDVLALTRPGADPADLLGNHRVKVDRPRLPHPIPAPADG